MITRLLGILIVLAFTAPVSLVVGAQPSDAEISAAKSFIRDLADETIRSLQDERLGDDELRGEFRDLMERGFVVEYMGRAVLGRYARQATPQQLAEYYGIFDDYMLEYLMSRLSAFTNEELIIRGDRYTKRGDIFVETTIDNATDSIEVDWRVRRRNEQYKIIDVVIEGASMLITTRDEFSSVAYTDGVDGLITAVRNKVLELNPDAFGPAPFPAALN